MQEEVHDLAEILPTLIPLPTPSPSLLPLRIYWNAKCGLHSIPHHPEQPARVDLILARLRLEWHAECFKESTPASIDDILRYHTAMLVDTFNANCDKVEMPNGIRRGKRGVINIDRGTAILRHTRAAVLCAAGAVINAVDDIYHPAGRLIR